MKLIFKPNAASREDDTCRRMDRGAECTFVEQLVTGRVRVKFADGWQRVVGQDEIEPANTKADPID